MDMVVSYDVLGWNNGSRESDHYRYGSLYAWDIMRCFSGGIGCKLIDTEEIINSIKI